MQIKVKKLYDNAVLPTRAHSSDAGYDLRIANVKQCSPKQITYGFGIAMEIPDGHVGLVFPRSSIKSKAVRLSNCVGVIDSGYRGEICAVFDIDAELKSFGCGYRFKSPGELYIIGDRAAQIIIMKLPDVEMVEADELSDSDRGTGGYGSTGN